MVELSIGDGRLKVEILGWHKFFAFKSKFLIPLDHVKDVRRDPEACRAIVERVEALRYRLSGRHLGRLVLQRRAACVLGCG